MSDARSHPTAVIVETISAAIGVGFVLSLFYDWGYAYAIDLNLAQLPTTVTDHFRSGILWFPPLIGLVLFYFAVEYQFQRVERGLSEDEIINTSKNPEKTRKLREVPYRFISWLMLLALVNFLMIGDTLSSVLPVVLSILWLKFSEWCNSTPLIRLRRSEEARVGFTLIPVAIICAFFFGYNAAVNAALREPHFVDVQIESGTILTDVKLLRVFEAGFLFMSPTNRISFVPMEQIIELRRKDEYQPFRGFICEYLKQCVDEDLNSSQASQPINSGGG